MALSSDAEHVLDLANKLDPNEMLEVAERLILEVRQRNHSTTQYDWDTIAGLADYPMVGEDAQEWVSRTRREADEHRMQQLRRSYDTDG